MDPMASLWSSVTRISGLVYKRDRKIRKALRSLAVTVRRDASGSRCRARFLSGRFSLSQGELHLLPQQNDDEGRAQHGDARADEKGGRFRAGNRFREK